MHSNIFVVGNAGSGKTTLAYAFNKWLNENNVCSIVSNLDPASEYFPYAPDFDIKKYIDVKDIMEGEGLGPNGAILRAVDLMYDQLDSWSRDIDCLGAQLRIFDTPGQLESLLYRNSGTKLFKKISCNDKAVVVYLLESTLASNPLSLTVLMMQATITKVRLDLPVILILSKIDLGIREDIRRLLSDNQYLQEKIVEEGVGGQKDTAFLLCKALSQIPWQQRLINVSALTKFGLGELYEITNEASCVCGDMT